MLTTEDCHASPAGLSENHQPEPPAALPQRCADWMSYAVALIQQAAPTATDFSSNAEF